MGLRGLSAALVVTIISGVGFCAGMGTQQTAELPDFADPNTCVMLENMQTGRAAAAEPEGGAARV